MAELLYDAIAKERRRLFVGRGAELAALDRWLGEPEAPTQIVSVTGMAGVGKSTLLLRMEEHGRSLGIPCTWIDGRACGRTPAGFLAYLEVAKGAGSGVGPRAGRDERSTANPDTRALWCIDNYDELEPIDGWLRERFFTNLPAYGHWVVLASRAQLSEGWRNDPGWARRLIHFPLEPFGRSDSRKYLQRAGVAEALVDELIDKTSGLPLALSLAADALRRRPVPDAGIEREWVLTVNAQLLREAAGGEVGPLLDVLAVAQEADAPLMASVIGEPLPAGLLASLARLSFVQRLPSGFRLHDVARRYLLTDMRERDDARFRRLRRAVVRALLRRLETASAAERTAGARTLLSVCADALPSAATYATFSSLPGIVIRTARAEDLPELYPLVDTWGRHSLLLRDPSGYRRLLERAVASFPESCRVVCGPRGERLAFLVTLLLSEETVACLDAIEKGALLRHMPKEYRRFAKLPAEKADTYFATLVGVDFHQEEYSSQELVGMLMRDGLARLSEGTRALVGASIPELGRLLERLGFTWYKGASGPVDPDVPEHRLWELDLRSSHFGAWVMSFLNAVDGEDPSFLEHEAISLEQLRALLSAWNDPQAWKESPVPIALGLNANELRATLKAWLTGTKPLPPPLTPEDREIVAQTVLRRLAPDAIADQLHISRATYYRHLQRAIERLREALVQGAS